MLDDAYLNAAFGILLVGLILLGIFWVEDKMQRQVDEAFARIDAMGSPDHLQESEAAGITNDWQAREEAMRRQFNEQCG
jgi:hypothetical protein